MKQVFRFSCNAGLLRLAVLLVFILPALRGPGQGLYKEFPFSQSGFHGKHIEVLPDGNYRIVFNNMSTFYGSGAFRHLLTTVDTYGAVLDSQQVSFTGRLAFWLKDMTFVHPYQDWMQGDSVFQFTRTNQLGDTLWTAHITVPPDNYHVEWGHMALDQAGNLWAAGAWIDDISNSPEPMKLILVKINPAGQVLWNSAIPTIPQQNEINESTVKFRIGTDGECFLKFTTNTGTEVARISAAGTILWKNVLPISALNNMWDFQLGQDKRSLLVGHSVSSSANVLIGLDSLGNTLFIKKRADLLSKDFDPVAVIATQDGNWVVGGYLRVDIIRYLVVIKLNAAGTVLWRKQYQITPGTTVAGTETAAGDLLWTGAPAFLIRMDSNGVTFKNHLVGRLAIDADVDCAAQADDTAIPGWLLRLENAGSVQYAVSGPDGGYYFPQVDTGMQALTPMLPNYLWEACQLPYTGYIHPDSSGYTLPLDAPLQAATDCPVMTVDLAIPFLRRCFNNSYAIRCCNNGNQTANDAYLEVYLPPHLLVQNASAPYVQDGLTLTFALGNVGPFECQDIQLVVKPDCDSTALGEAMCVSAHIFPDTLCGTVPGWSGALIEVSAACDGDSARFEIRNTGSAPTSQPLDFIVIDDHVMTLQGNFNLAPQQTYAQAFPADGSTWRLLAEQEPGAPGAPAPSVAVQGCGSGPLNAGLIVQWPNENGSPFWERDCHEIIGAFDPNDKHAAPTGVDAPHWIKPNTPVECLIRFQNTGTDTAFTVEIRDTLSPHLLAESLRPGAASHAYAWSLSADGVLRFVFENILLPDSSTNLAASQGFVQFQIYQRPDLPDGTVFENRAGIYFDFNAPVITNTVFHTIGRNFLPTVSVFDPAAAVSAPFFVYPNPAHDRAVVFFKNKIQPGGNIALFDGLGRELFSGPVSESRMEVRRQGLAAGLYWLRWTDMNGRVHFARLVWQ